MAQVQYLVLYKYLHPDTKKPITNTTKENYEPFVKAYDKTNVNTEDILLQESPSNPKYDMLYMFSGVTTLDNKLGGAIQPTKTVTVEEFTRCNGDAWFVASKHSSLKAALTAADPTIRSIGKENVKVVKSVPIDISVGIE